MTPEFIYLVGDVLFWVGLIHALASGIRWMVRRFSAHGDSATSRLLIQVAIGGVLMLLSSGLTRDVGRPAENPHLPLVWLYMPFPGWLGVVSAFFTGKYALEAWAESRAPERLRPALWSACWLVIGVISLVLLKVINGRAWIFRGYLPIDLKVTLALVLLGVVAVALMIFSERNARLRGLSSKFASTLALLVGTCIFGIPLGWQLITSFKEQRDQSTANGFIWIPQVQETHAFYDKEKPLYTANYEGQKVKARLDSKTDDRKAMFEIERPYSIRGIKFKASLAEAHEIARDAPVYSYTLDGVSVKAYVVNENDDGTSVLNVTDPPDFAGRKFSAETGKLSPVRHVGLRVENYTESLEWMPPETHNGLVYLINTLVLVALNVTGTILSCSVVAYGFSRIRFPGRDILFNLLLSTLMLPSAVTLMPQFLIFRSFGWIDTFHPLWVPSLFAGAFNVFLLKQFFGTIPMELEEAARIDGCGYFRTFWSVMLPQVKPALAAIGIWTFMGTWNNFMGPLIYISSSNKMPIVYALALFFSDRGTDLGLIMAFSTMAMLPVLLLFFFAQRFFVEGVQLSGLGGR